MPRFGILNVNKPAGLTSRDVVNRVYRLVRPDKAGHAGTLDPLATGVLLVVVGQATRLIDCLHRFPKRYMATFQLGCQSPTEDTEGPVTPLVDSPRPSREQLDRAAGVLVGPILQSPPAYSAVKIAGRRAYALARRGKAVALPPRPITIHELHVVQYDYPLLVLDIACSTGAYIRSLGRDLARSLGTEAVMTDLVRTAIGSFSLDAGWSLDRLSAETVDAALLPAARAVEALPTVTVGPAEIVRLRHGLYIEMGDRAPPACASAAEYAALDSGGRLIALLTPRGEGQLGARVNFVGE